MHSYLRNGLIPKEQTELSKKPFAVIGALDAVAGIMQIFSVSLQLAIQC